MEDLSDVYKSDSEKSDMSDHHDSDLEEKEDDEDSDDDLDMSKLERLTNARRTNVSHLRDLVDEYTWRLVSCHTPNWLTCPIFKTMLAKNRQEFDRACTPMSFAPNPHDILSSASPPTLDFFTSLPHFLVLVRRRRSGVSMSSLWRTKIVRQSCILGQELPSKVA